MIAVLPMLLSSILALSEDPPPESIKVCVLVILGSTQNDEVHALLKEIAPELRKKDPQLKGFELYKTHNPSIKKGDPASLDLIDKEKVVVTVNEKTDDEGRFTLTIKLPMIDEIKYCCTCGKFFPIMTNYYTEDKRRLIVAIMAKPCKKK